MSRFFVIHICLFLILGTVGAQCGSSPEPSPETITVIETVIVGKEVGEVGEDILNTLVADSKASASQGESKRQNRLIIKNAELKLLVEDTDTILDRSLGIITEYGGYTISSHTWFRKDLKYATLAIGVPVENFEAILGRFKGLGVAVQYENISGEDVTEQYVDLESQLGNLEATARRIRSFLDEAETVEDALDVNRELTSIEGQIEGIKGKMVYLEDRAIYSIITLEISPEEVVAKADAWSLTTVFEDAFSASKRINKSVYQFVVSLGIWTVLVILPLLLPPLVLVLLVFWFIRRRKINRQISMVSVK